MYAVFDNGKYASVEGYPELTDPRWQTSRFASFAEARDYASKYLGDFGPFPPFDCEIMLNIKHDYSGCGDFIWIEQVI